MSILDLTVIDNDALSIQNALHAWLHDCSTDQEHLHLILPPSSVSSMASDQDGVRFSNNHNMCIAFDVFYC